ncbi:myocyte-specific enhancer factor 2A [Denticeps clupeoides]|uniref:MADS-box domain-containing protein n=1 Tax=Denticeps clupeoides TaxID=299321 RepID=A0AAY4EXD8_9TELE|nr:myocyte-specific enhancer factor 2A-like [Denticeps clupeoides]XP_028812756.1 myocyte-specific enhancer factor 2A-like [Denticeps clupeoides]
MGRKKIQITRIVDERNRQVTFTKRKFGLMKKAYELSVLCDCEIALIIFNGSNKLFQYASTDMDKVLLKYTEYNEPHESRTNSDIVEALNKKEQRGCDSPDPEGSCILTPHTEEKYKKINEEFDNMMRNHKIPAGLPQHNFSMHTANSGALSYSSSCTIGPQSLASVSAALSDGGVISPSHGSLHRNVGSPGLSQRPPSSGTVNGFVGNISGNSFGKVLSTKPPSPPGENLSVCSRKPDLRVVLPPHGNLTIPPAPEQDHIDLNAQRINSSQATQSLTAPTVSATTPSLPHQGLVYAAMVSTYNTDYCADLSNLQGFSSSGGLSLGSVSPWPQHQMGPAALCSPVAGNHIPHGTNQGISIKSEPTSPPRDLPDPGFLAQPAVSARTGHSPAQSRSSSCNSYDGAEHEERRTDFQPPTGPSGGHGGTEECQGTSVKRVRLDNWIT